MPHFPNKFLKAQTCNITSKNLTELTQYGFVTQVGRRGNPHKWAIEFQTPPMRAKEARELQAFIDSLEGRYKSFTIDCPLPWMTSSNNIGLTSSHVAGQETINIDFGVPVEIGEFIKFSNHDKCYKITDHDSGGNTMDIHPRLQRNLLITDTFDKAVFTCRMASDNASLNLDARKGLHPVLISAIEA